MSIIADIRDMLDELGKDVEIQRKTIISGGYGGDTVSWSKLADVVIAIQNLTGTEIEATQKRGIEATFKGYMLPADIATTDRIFYNNKYFFITYIDNRMQLGDYLTIYFTESDTYDSQSN